MYYNDVVNCVKHCYCRLFADDTMLFISGVVQIHIEVMIKKLNENLEKII
jgi:hypothetical protein